MRTPPAVLTPRQRAVLERISRARTVEQRLVERASMVLAAADGASDQEQARRLRVDAQRPRRWRNRWIEAAAAITAAEAEGVSEHDHEVLILRALSDDARSGTPPTFSAEAVARLISLACEPPADSGLPINHWTPAELATEAVKRGIVESISPRHLDRIMKRGAPPASQESLLDDIEGQARESRSVR